MANPNTVPPVPAHPAPPHPASVPGHAGNLADQMARLRLQPETPPLPEAPGPAAAPTHSSRYYRGYTFVKSAARPGHKPSWTHADRTRMDRSQAELERLVQRRAERVSPAEQYRRLSRAKRAHVDGLLYELRQIDRGAEWHCMFVREEERPVRGQNSRRGDYETVSMDVVVKNDTLLDRPVGLHAPVPMQGRAMPRDDYHQIITIEPRPGPRGGENATWTGLGGSRGPMPTVVHHPPAPAPAHPPPQPFHVPGMGGASQMVRHIGPGMHPGYPAGPPGVPPPMPGMDAGSRTAPGPLATIIEPAAPIPRRMPRIHRPPAPTPQSRAARPPPVVIEQEDWPHELTSLEDEEDDESIALYQEVMRAARTGTDEEDAEPRRGTFFRPEVEIRSPRPAPGLRRTQYVRGHHRKQHSREESDDNTTDEQRGRSRSIEVIVARDRGRSERRGRGRGRGRGRSIESDSGSQSQAEAEAEAERGGAGTSRAVVVRQPRATMMHGPVRSDASRGRRRSHDIGRRMLQEREMVERRDQLLLLDQRTRQLEARLEGVLGEDRGSRTREWGGE